MKIRLTSGQLDRLMLHEQKTRSKAPLNEGTKEVLLGVAKLMEINLTGLNKELAENALADKTTMSEIKHTLESPEKIKELINTLAEKGVKTPEKLLAKNAKKIIDSYNKLSEEKLDAKAGLNLASLDKESSDSLVMN